MQLQQPCRLCWIHQEYEVQVVQTQGEYKKWKLDCLWFDQTFWGEPPGGHGGGNICTAGGVGGQLRGGEGLEET